MMPFRWLTTGLYVQVVLGLVCFIATALRFWLTGREVLDQCSGVEAALAALPVGQRVALVPRRYRGRSYAEIAAALHCSEDAARASVYAALGTLRKCLRETTAAGQGCDQLGLQ